MSLMQESHSERIAPAEGNQASAPVRHEEESQAPARSAVACQPLVPPPVPQPLRPLPPVNVCRPFEQQSGFPNWGITAIATLALASILIIGVIFSQHLSAPSASSSPAMNTSTSGNTTSANSSSAPVSPPAHQLYPAQAPATLQGNAVNVTLTVKEELISIAPDVAYHAWTFNGTVPGPVIRVRQGQIIHFTLKNEGMMPHSIDFHAAQTPWNINYQEVPVGKSFSFDWTANYPGVFLYHCGAPVVIYHMANGMYGMIIVDPAQGWAPAQEYTLVQTAHHDVPSFPFSLR